MTLLLALQILLLWNLLSLIIYVFLLLSQDRRLQSRLKDKKYLMTIAHPDDESMFFGPLLNSLANWGARLRLLCLSSGNFYGVGDLRRQELFHAAKEYGLEAEDVSLVDDSRLPDSMQQMWASDDILEFVDENCRENAKICRRSSLAMISFDAVGVTKHPNHISIHQALSSPSCDKGHLLTLVSIPFFVQYTGSLSCLPFIVVAWLWKKLLYSRLSATKKDVFLVVSSPSDWLRTLRAMRCHKSQMMWFRVLHLMLSSYLLVNIIEHEVSNA